MCKGHMSLSFIYFLYGGPTMGAQARSFIYVLNMMHQSERCKPLIVGRRVFVFYSNWVCPSLIWNELLWYLVFLYYLYFVLCTFPFQTQFPLFFGMICHPQFLLYKYSFYFVYRYFEICMVRCSIWKSQTWCKLLINTNKLFIALCT